MTDGAPEASPAIPAATVVLLRDGEQGLETLMLRRNPRLEFAGGLWVWPGGRIDPGDYAGASPAAPSSPAAPTHEGSAGLDQLEAAARRAAVREAREEAGLGLDPDELVWFSHWTPPGITPKRFATFFFVARAPAGAIQVDGGEIHGYAWLAPVDVLRRRNAGELGLSPPTWITLEHLCPHPDVARALAALGAGPPEWFTTRFASVDGGAVALYHGDAGYEDQVVDRAGGRHRLWMLQDGWRYERST